MNICYFNMLLCQEKKFYNIDQQKAQHFVHFDECLYHAPSLLCNSNNNPFLTSMI